MESNLIVAIISSLLTQGAKKVQSIPINAGQVAKLRFLVGALSLVGAGAEAYLNGTLSDPNYINLLSDSIYNYALSTGVYAGFLKKS